MFNQSTYTFTESIGQISLPLILSHSSLVAITVNVSTNITKIEGNICKNVFIDIIIHILYIFSIFSCLYSRLFLLFIAVLKIDFFQFVWLFIA